MRAFLEDSCLEAVVALAGPRQHAASFRIFWMVPSVALRSEAADPALDEALDATLALSLRTALPQHALRTSENFAVLSQVWSHFDHGVPGF